jgi:N-acetylglucosaminyldiphosphoundecaprenol N-acetyl-beta-D-mannosaminyltransferase
MPQTVVPVTEQASHPFETARVGGVPFALTTLTDAAAKTAEQAVSNRSAPRPSAIRLSNAYCVALAAEDEAYRQLLTGDGVNFPDGAPVAWLLKRSAERSEQVRGPSYFLETIKSGIDLGVRHYFFGATAETLEQLVFRLRDKHPAVRIAGTLAPPFGTVDDILSERNVEAISATNPDIVWVGLGTPKQDFVASRLAAILNVPCAGVGAAFDFTAGTIKEAPKALQGSGFEWLYRLMSEPRRLWRRYLVGNAKFLIAAARHR